jgi:hypothetical protein
VTDFGSQFIESQGRPIDYEGKSVHMSYVSGPLPKGVVTIRMTARGELEQGVGVSVDGGWLTANGVKGKRFDLWTETAPVETVIDLKPLRGRASACVRGGTSGGIPSGVPRWRGSRAPAS